MGKNSRTALATTANTSLAGKLATMATAASVKETAVPTATEQTAENCNCRSYSAKSHQ